MHKLSPQTFATNHAYRNTDKRAAQGELPLHAVQRASPAQNTKSAKGGKQDQPNPQQAQTTAASPTSVNLQTAMKEGIRRRSGELKIQAEALLQRISLSTPEAAASLGKELRRLALELKQLMAQYKALSSAQGSLSRGKAKPAEPRVTQNASVSQSGIQNSVSQIQVKPASAQGSGTVASDASINRAFRAAESSLRAIEAELNQISTTQTAINTYDTVQTLGEEQSSELNTDELRPDQDPENQSMTKLFRDILEKLKLASEMIETLAHRDTSAQDSPEALKNLNDANLYLSEIEQMIGGMGTA